ncbi:MAG: LD-carboxypeptidase [Propionibacteriaceae bacterium]|jgi:muramoyltetrapeptide carboxypeptidase|nr:LD-carboxypeptidase [Propionibacteriaceae bacterium]
MLPARLTPGDTIGVISPSSVLDEVKYARDVAVLNRLGFQVTRAANVTQDTDGYIASAQERADDLNSMVADDSVKMILFSGGDGAIELLPLIDYDNIAAHPKIFSSFSDATSLLLAIHARTGLVTYYGAGIHEFTDLRQYDYEQFQTHFVDGCENPRFVSDSVWRTLAGGRARGRLIGGYAGLFALMLASPYFSYDDQASYLLFIEDHEYFSEVGTVNTYLSIIEQSPFMANVTGLMFGHYALEVPADLLSRLERFGRRNDIPVIYTDDFGHGTRHAIFPIGVEASLDADAQTLMFGGPLA